MCAAESELPEAFVYSVEDDGWRFLVGRRAAQLLGCLDTRPQLPFARRLADLPKSITDAPVTTELRLPGTRGEEQRAGKQE